VWVAWKLVKILFARTAASVSAQLKAGPARAIMNWVLRYRYLAKYDQAWR